MEDFDVSSKQDLEQFESAYNEELMAEQGASPNTKFNYAFCLVRSPHRDDISFGLQLLSELGRLPEYQRDFMFYSALGCYRLHDYVAAKKLPGRASLVGASQQTGHLSQKKGRSAHYQRRPDWTCNNRRSCRSGWIGWRARIEAIGMTFILHGVH
eukprot:Opistho-2@33674